MAIQILMPALSPTMTEGKLARWLKSEGDEVRSGDVLAEIETDKATMEMEAVEEGRLGKILVDEGTEGVHVNTPIAVLLEEGEQPGDAAKVMERRPMSPLRSPRRHRPRRRCRLRRRPAPRVGRRQRRGRVARPCAGRSARRCATPWPWRCAATRPCF